MGSSPGPRIGLISLGGNAILRRGERGTVEEELANTRACMAQVARMLERGQRVVITHGNGPIVGNIVLQNEAARNVVPPMPLYICDADTEGGIGFLIQQTLHNRLKRIRHVRQVVTLITQVVVDGNDPAFRNPSKPIGPYYSAEEASSLRREKGWVLMDTGKGFRRVVPSPRPLAVIEVEVIRRLALEGVVVIAGGGGGIPVVQNQEGDLVGVDAVVDKDLTTAVLARELAADSILILTAVDRVYLNYGRPDQAPLADVTLEEIRAFHSQGHFPPGSMGPKIEAAIQFLEAGGRQVVITAPELAVEAVAGRAGTRIRP